MEVHHEWRGRAGKERIGGRNLTPPVAEQRPIELGVDDVAITQPSERLGERPHVEGRIDRRFDDFAIGTARGGTRKHTAVPRHAVLRRAEMKEADSEPAIGFDDHRAEHTVANAP
jgi:hypothetical protein